MKNEIWYLDGLDFNKILCPYKLVDYEKKNPAKVFQKHDFLFLEEDPCRDILLIDRGKVKVGHYDRNGNEQIIAFLGKGEILGQMALLGDTFHRTFAEVMENNTQVCKMSVDKARELTRDNVPFALEMNRRIGDQIKKLERRIEILLFKNIKTRMLELLKDLGNEHGRPRDGGIWVSHSLTQQDIADLIGTSRKTASLTLNELENEGLIEFDRKHIFITDPKKLDLAVFQSGFGMANA
ncbi:MAG: Crp/Fnr family transcriptional regulator [Saprospiraceae bacterium]|nr:Crp/Fnr family transcriptional regulator [Saprospiraceae bacterium]